MWRMEHCVITKHCQWVQDGTEGRKGRCTGLDFAVEGAGEKSDEVHLAAVAVLEHLGVN